MDNTTIEVRGAREHNLRNVSAILPRNQLIVFSGVSGSGKSSMAFDTLYAEGQRRYLESLSSYARQFIGQLPKPNVDYISGLSLRFRSVKSQLVPTRAVLLAPSPRSMTSCAFSMLALQPASAANAMCPITSQTRDQIVARIQAITDTEECLILAPIVRGQKGEYRDLFESLQRQGFARARIDGQVMRLADAPALARNQKHDIEVVVAKLHIQSSPRVAFADAVNEALRLGMNTLIVIPWQEPTPSDAKSKSDEDNDEVPPEITARSAVKRRAARTSSDLVMSSEYACPQCGASSSPPSPQLLVSTVQSECVQSAKDLESSSLSHHR